MSGIDSEIAQKLLQANTINMVGKLAGGGTLSRDERAYLELVTQSDSSESSAVQPDSTLSQPKPAAEYLLKTEDVCKRLEISRASFFRWKKYATFPQVVSGKGWPIQEIEEWMSGRKTGKGKNPSRPSSKIEDPEKQLKVKKLGIHVAELEGSVIWVDQHKEVIAHLVDAWLIPLNRLPGTLASMIDPENPAWVEDIVREYTKEMIEEMKKAATATSKDGATVREKRARPSTKSVSYTRFS